MVAATSRACESVGFVSSGPDAQREGWLFDTSVRGNGNGGQDRCAGSSQEAFRGRGSGVEELTLAQLVRIGASEAEPAERRNAVRANFHFRMVEVAMMLLLPLLAVALAVPP